MLFSAFTGEKDVSVRLCEESHGGFCIGGVVMFPGQHIGEVVESATGRFVFQTYEVDGAPQFGALVGVAFAEGIVVKHPVLRLHLLPS